MLNDILSFSYTNELGFRLFTGRISLEKYIKKEVDMINTRASWCYGPIGIGKAIYMASNILKSEKGLEIANSSFDYLVKFPEKWELKSPTICHGFAGLLAYFQSIPIKNNETKIQVNNILNILVDMYDEKTPFGYKDENLKESKEGTYEANFEDRINFNIGTLGVVMVLLNSINNGKAIWMRKLSCPSQPWLACLTPVIGMSQEYSCACPGASVTDRECTCPPDDNGTLDVCINATNNRI